LPCTPSPGSKLAQRMTAGRGGLVSLLGEAGAKGDLLPCVGVRGQLLRDIAELRECIGSENEQPRRVGTLDRGDDRLSRPSWVARLLTVPVLSGKPMSFGCRLARRERRKSP